MNVTHKHQREPERLLENTPYLVSDGAEGERRFDRIHQKSVRMHDRARYAAGSIASAAARMYEQYAIAVRSELVAESNRLEGIDVAPKDVRNLSTLDSGIKYETQREQFVEAIEEDEKLIAALGLYRAYEIADEWAMANSRPREFEVRSLHGLIVPDKSIGGRYKIAPNEIGGSVHEPVDPLATPHAMESLSSWFSTGTSDPVLDAAVVHAWLTHIHPFDDGNGRMARLLANMALVQAEFPPLLLSSRTERGRYLDALAESDEGDILPLYELFTDAISRSVKLMEKPNYVERKITPALLSTGEDRYLAWSKMIEDLVNGLRTRARIHGGWKVRDMGIPDIEAFELLLGGSIEGNSWLAKIYDPAGVERWLIWAGFRSEDGCDMFPGKIAWPSVFLSARDFAYTNGKPWRSLLGARYTNFPAELCPIPYHSDPVGFRIGHSWEAGNMHDALRALEKLFSVPASEAAASGKYS